MTIKRKKEPWPTKAVMHQIYEKKMWGGAVDFYSGLGSHSPEIVGPYIREVSLFLNSFSTRLEVCDLGCGDFNVGKQLVLLSKKYIAVDIVPNLIERNKSLFKEENLEFLCLDISKDKLPNADCAIVRQVMQHISNAEILSLLKKLKNYKYLIITEHLPLDSFVPNKDIISGQGIRLKKNSGVDILQPPFLAKTKLIKNLTTSSYDSKSAIFTNLYQNF
ncbi:methyltransferase family protein [Maribacter vaceletii]|uniref:Methyltransferase family protein n=1 Tax=Maribacter vaceletii TaxID=1206816 RepID=A0A495EEI7_9FLAO|nr:class I SAM-dependent methyltransferase [Maribacter vaceletii]RKR15308.1 methyltransferase family protein [Maribacter vaceletii]